jgi:hypothetical protein
MTRPATTPVFIRPDWAGILDFETASRGLPSPRPSGPGSARPKASSLSGPAGKFTGVAIGQLGGRGTLMTVGPAAQRVPAAPLRRLRGPGGRRNARQAGGTIKADLHHARSRLKAALTDTAE